MNASAPLKVAGGAGDGYLCSMRTCLLIIALAGLPAMAQAAQPVNMICTGSRTSPAPGTGAMTTQAVSFRLELNPVTRRVVQDGKVMVVRQWSEGRVVFSDYNPGILGALAGSIVTTLDRKSGAWRDKWGRGSCVVQGRNGS